jgi:hypothetical protein
VQFTLQAPPSDVDEHERRTRAELVALLAYVSIVDRWR